MLIDFKAVNDGDMKLADYAAQFQIDDLRAATNESIDYLLSLIADLSDADIVFDPQDETALDPHAISGEEHIGWGIGHLIAHVTASCEEWASYSAILARGVPYGPEPRLRYETPWREIDSKARAVQRLEESRRMRLACLDTWPDQPDMTNLRELSPRFTARMGDMNAVACFLFGFKHEVGHYEQFHEVLRQISAARHQAAAAG